MTKLSWTLIAGILFVRMALFMSYPFLALTLTDLAFEPFEIGLILGFHYLFAGISGTIGGSLASQWKPKQAIILALLVGSFCFWGLSASTSFFEFLFFNSLLAISTSTFEPIISMLITSNTPESVHAYAFRCRYLAINIGAAIGPMIGILVLAGGSSLSFSLTAIFLALYCLFFSLLDVGKIEASGSTKGALSYMAKDSAFLYLIAANIFVTMTYGQIFSTLPQILSQRMEESRTLYLILLTINPFIVISVSLFFNTFLSKQRPQTLFTIGSLLLLSAFLGFELIPLTYVNYISCMVLFTLGEILLIPTTSKFLFDLSPVQYQGAYLGAESSSFLGFFLGNLIGGWLLQHHLPVFLFCSAAALGGFFFYRIAYKKSLSNDTLEVL